MKIKELIDLLSKQDQELEVIITDNDDDSFVITDEIEVVSDQWIYFGNSETELNEDKYLRLNYK
mgnify:CR=1 FL=1